MTGGYRQPRGVAGLPIAPRQGIVINWLDMLFASPDIFLLYKSTGTEHIGAVVLLQLDRNVNLLWNCLWNFMH